MVRGMTQPTARLARAVWPHPAPASGAADRMAAVCADQPRRSPHPRDLHQHRSAVQCATQQSERPRGNPAPVGVGLHQGLYAVPALTRRLTSQPDVGR